MGAAPSAVPTGNPGNQVAALAKVREAYKILEQTLPSFQMGTELHSKVLNLMNQMVKLAPPSSEIPGMAQTTLGGLQQAAQKDAGMQALQRAQGSPATAGAGAGAGAAPPQGVPAPAMPPSLAA
jgi:hypothetical protein